MRSGRDWSNLLRAAADSRRPWSWRLDGAIVAALAALTVLTRLPYLGRYLYEIDAVNFALALERFDVAAMRPHPPGYPVFVGMGHVLTLAWPNPHHALLAETLLFSAATTALLYALARAWTSIRASTAAAVLFGVAPVFWYHGLVALSYTAEAAGSVGVALLAWRARLAPTRPRIIALAAGWAVAVGLRQSLFIYLGPLVLYAVLAPPIDLRGLLRRAFLGSAVAISIVAAWFVPTVAFSTNGWQGYSRATAWVNHYVIFHRTVFNAGFDALLEHWDRLLLFLRPEAVLLVPFLVFLLVGLILRRRSSQMSVLEWPEGARRFFAIWLLPSLLFYLLIFNGLYTVPSGYVLVFLPGLYLLFASVGDTTLRRLSTVIAPPKASAGAVPVGLFLLLLPGIGLVDHWSPLWESKIRDPDDWAAGWAALPEAFPPNETAILSWYSWPHVKWNFPDYLCWNYTPYPLAGGPGWILTRETQQREDDVSIYEGYLRGPGGPGHPVPESVRFIVLFDFQLAGENGEISRLAADVPVLETSLTNDWRVLYIPRDSNRTTIEDYFRDPAEVAGFA